MNADWAPCGHQPSDQANRLGLSQPVKADAIHIHIAKYNVQVTRGFAPRPIWGLIVLRSLLPLPPFFLMLPATLWTAEVIVSLVTGQLADMPTRRLNDSRTGQVADWTTRGWHQRLCVLSFSFWRHLRDRESVSYTHLTLPTILRV